MTKRTITLLCLIAPMILASRCATEQTESFEEMARRTYVPQRVLVSTIEVQPEVFYHEIMSNGKIHASEKVEIPIRVQGVWSEVNVANGQWVNEGDLLARIEDYSYRLNLSRARIRLNHRELELATELSVSSSSSTDEERIKNRRVSLGITEAELALEEAEYNFNNTKIVAPISGYVANMEARRHGRTGSTFCTIVNHNIMEVEFPVIESEFRHISSGMPVTVIPFIYDTLRIEGMVTEINPIVDPNGMIRVRAQFSNSGNLIEGMNVRVLLRNPDPDRLVVPREALVTRQGRDVIFVREDSTAIWRYVNIEFENSTHVAIKPETQPNWGISPGDRVIVRGNINLAHQTVVTEDER